MQPISSLWRATWIAGNGVNELGIRVHQYYGVHKNPTHIHSIIPFLFIFRQYGMHSGTVQNVLNVERAPFVHTKTGNSWGAHTVRRMPRKERN